MENGKWKNQLPRHSRVKIVPAFTPPLQVLVFTIFHLPFSISPFSARHGRAAPRRLAMGRRACGHQRAQSVRLLAFDVRIRLSQGGDPPGAGPCGAHRALPEARRRHRVAVRAARRSQKCHLQASVVRSRALATVQVVDRP
jgi:hypothetical protein